MILRYARYLFRILLIICAILAEGKGALAQNWILLQPPGASPNLNALHFFSPSSGFVAGAAGQLFKTNDGGNIWIPVALPGSPGAINDLQFVDGTFGALVGDGGYIAVTTDAGTTWTQRSVPVEWSSGGDVEGVHFKNRDTGYVVGKAAGGGNGPRMAMTTNGGVTWTNVALRSTPANNLYDIDFFDTDHGAVVGTGQPPRKSMSTNAGRTWSDYDSVGTRDTASLSFYGIDAVDGTPIGFAAGGKVVPPGPLRGEVRKTSDFAASWVRVTSPGPEPLGGIAALTQSLLFVSARSGRVYKSTDGGNNWILEALPVGARPIGVGTADLRRFSRTANFLFLAGDRGVVLRYTLTPDATFDPAQLDFGKVCPGNSNTLELAVGNIGATPLVIDSIVITQPAAAGATFTVVSKPATVAPGSTGIVTVRVDAAPNAPPALYTGTMRVYNNDENYTGADRNKAIPLRVAVTTKTLSVDNTVNKDAGPLRVGGAFSKSFTLSNIITNTGECPVRISVRLARGVDFSLDPPLLTGLTSGQNGSIYLTFEPKAACERYDTVIIEHDAVTPASPIRIPIVGRGIVQSYGTSPRDTLDFGGVQLGSALSGELNLLNNAFATNCLDTTNVYSFKIVGPNAAEFTTPFSIPEGGRVPLEPGASYLVPITAQPTTPGRRIAYAVITSDLHVTPPDTVVLIVNGLKPELTTIGSEIRFGLTDVGGRRDSTVRDFLRNLSNAEARVVDARIVGLNASDFVYDGPAPDFTMPPGARQSLQISFRPTAPGTRVAILELLTDINATPLRVDLTGTAVRALGAARSSIVVFSSTSVNDCRDTVLTKFIQNNGSVPLRIVNARIDIDPSGDPTDPSAFTILAPAIPPDLVIDPGDSASISLRFCPKAPRPYYARLILDNNSDVSPFDLQLVGTGRSSQVVAIDSVVFAPTRVLTVRDTVVTKFIINRESGPLVVDSISISGADPESFTLLAPSFPFTIAPAGDTVVGIRFNPKRRDRHNAFLNVYTTQGLSVVILTGQAIYPLLAIEPDRAASLRVRIGSTRGLQINVVNIGDDSGRVEKAVLNAPASYTNVTTDPLPRTLMPGDTVRMFFDFTPDRLCEQSARIEISGEGVRGVYALADTSVTFAGIGTGPLVSSRRPEINFGIRTTTPVDSVLDDFIGNIDFAGALNACLDSTAIDSMVITGTDAASFAITAPSDPLSTRPLGVAALQSFSLRFQPPSSGLKRAELRVYHSGRVDSVLTVELLGAVTSLPIVFGPFENMFEIDFGNVRIGTWRDSIFTVTNISPSSLSIDELASTLPAEMQILSPASGFTLTPNVSAEISVRFAPVVPPGRREGFVRLRSGTRADSSFRLVGNAVDVALRSEADTIDFGTRAPGTPIDTAAVLINESIAGIIDPPFLDSAIIDDARIVSGNAYYDLLSFPQVIHAEGRDSLLLRFRPSGPFARRGGLVRVYYNRWINGSATTRDSLDIHLTGVVAGSLHDLHANLGPGATASPGERIAFPIVLTGDVAGAAFDTLDITIGFRKTMLKPVGLITAQAGVVATLELPPDAPTTDGRAHLHFTKGGAFEAGTVAYIEFSVMLGDALETMVRYDSIGVDARPDLLFASDSARFAIADFCDAEGRLIRFDSLLVFASKPNPAARTTNISYTLPAIVQVRLSVYNGAGAEMARLVDEEQMPGYYLIPFDASMLASGTYYCILTAGRFTKTLTLQILE